MKPFDEVHDSDDAEIADWRGILINRMKGMDIDKVADEARLARTTVQDFVSGKTICPSIRTFKRISRAVDARFALHESGTDPRKTHELRLTTRERKFVRALMQKHKKE